MSDGFLTSTSSEGLQTLGSAAQRSFELIVGSLRSALDDTAATLFAEPISTARSGSVEWYAPVHSATLAPAQQSLDIRADLAHKVAKQRSRILRETRESW